MQPVDAYSHMRLALDLITHPYNKVKDAILMRAHTFMLVNDGLPTAGLGGTQ